MTELSGVLLIDKPEGMTSHDVVGRLRQILDQRSVGHAGTLDPLATGLLICLLGEATKLSQYVMSEEKFYRVGVRLGVTTDSGDITGQVVSRKEAVAIGAPAASAAVASLVGTLSLPVPLYSAVKINGRKLYEYARQNEAVEAPTKAMTIHEARLVETTSDKLTVELRCEKGTYVRSWVEKLGEILGTGATVETLRRLSSGSFSVDKSVTLETLDKAEGGAGTYIVPMAQVLKDWPALKLLPRDQGLVRNGQLPRGVESQILLANPPQGVRLLDDGGDLLALVVKDEAKGFKLGRVFRTSH